MFAKALFSQVLWSNVFKKHEKSNIRPVLSLQDSSGTCPEVPPGPEGQARPDLSPTFEYSGYLVFPRDLNYFCIANLNCIANTKVVYLKYSKHWPYTVAYTIDCVCSKMFNHGLNHRLSFHFSSSYPAPNIEKYMC